MCNEGHKAEFKCLHEVDGKLQERWARAKMADPEPLRMCIGTLANESLGFVVRFTGGRWYVSFVIPLFSDGSQRGTGKRYHES